jgi:signal transduction histidine kinase
VALHAEAGLDVTVMTTGKSIALAPPIEQAAYRIIQEALTNASRHGRGTACIGLAYGADALTIEVTNPVTIFGPNRFGHGLLGATERAHQFGGSLVATTRDQSFVLEATLPYGDSPGHGRDRR